MNVLGSLSEGTHSETEKLMLLKEREQSGVSPTVVVADFLGMPPILGENSAGPGVHR